MLRKAFQHYTETLLPGWPEKARYCAFQRFSSESEDSDAREVWTGVQRFKVTDDGEIHWALPITERHLLSHFWKGQIAEAAGPGKLEWALTLPSFFLRLGKQALPWYLGDGYDGPELTGKRLRLPGSESWIRVGTGADHLGYFLVDLDFKRDDDQELFDAALGFLTTAVGIPRPGLIVTSKSGRGRHLYYFLDHVGPKFGGRTRVPLVTRAARAFEDRLKALLKVDTLPHVIEVFPKSDKSGANMPYLPFGPCSYFCDEHGEVISKEPLKSLRQWYQMGPVQKISITQIRKMRVTAVRKKLIGTLRLRVEIAEDQDQEEVEIALPMTQLAPAEPLSRPTEKDAVASLRHGARRGVTNRELLMVVRYLKFSLNLSQEQGFDRLRKWVKSAVTTKNSMAHYERRIKDVWKRAEHPFTASAQFTLCGNDPEFIARQIVSLQIQDVWLRKACTLLALGIIGIARHRFPKAQGVAHKVPVYSVWMKEWTENYVTAKRLLQESGLVAIDQPHVKKSSREPGRMTEYGIRLPKVHGTMPKTFSSLNGAWDYFISALPDDLGEKLAGKRNWPNWKKAAGH